MTYFKHLYLAFRFACDIPGIPQVSREKTNCTVTSEDVLIRGFISSCSVPLHIESLSLLICKQHHSSWQTFSLKAMNESEGPTGIRRMGQRHRVTQGLPAFLPEICRAAWQVMKLLYCSKSNPCPLKHQAKISETKSSAARAIWWNRSLNLVFLL